MQLLKRVIFTNVIILALAVPLFVGAVIMGHRSFKGIVCPAQMVIPVVGYIGALGNSNVFLKNFGHCPNTYVLINTPGGSAQQSEMFRDTLLDLKERGFKTKCIVTGMADSGGAYILSGCAIKCVVRGSEVMFHDAYTLEEYGLVYDSILYIENMLNSYKVSKGLGISFLDYRKRLKEAPDHDWYLSPSEKEQLFKVIEKDGVCE